MRYGTKSGLHFAGGAVPPDMLKFDAGSDFAVSLWDDGAFSTRFTPTGTATTNPIRKLRSAEPVETNEPAAYTMLPQ